MRNGYYKGDTYEWVYSREWVETVKPAPHLPRFYIYIHAEVNSTDYISHGRYRRAHEEVIFHYTLRGSGEFYNKNGRVRTRPGQGVLLVVNDPDSGYCYPADVTEPWEYICFAFIDGPSRELAQRLIDDCGCLYTIPLDHPTMCSLLDFEKQPVNVMRAHDSAAYVFNVYTMLVEAAEKPVSPRVHPVVQKIREQVAAHIDENPTVEGLARSLGYSREYLCRLFRARTGKTLKDYIVQERTERACYLLKQEGCSVASVAERMQYTSSSNFARSFRAVMGISPAEFREKRMYHGSL